MSGSYGGVRRDDYARHPHDRDHEGAEQSGRRLGNDEARGDGQRERPGDAGHGHGEQAGFGTGSRDDGFGGDDPRMRGRGQGELPSRAGPGSERQSTGFMGRRDYSWSEVGARTGAQMDHRGKGPRGYKRSDDRIREDVSDRLSDDPVVDASDIEVAVSGGEVTLTGHVDSKQAKRRAEDVVEMVSGVTDVQNNLRVRRSEEHEPHR